MKEIKLVKRIIEVNVDKYFFMLEELDKMDICELDQVCVDISRAVVYIRKIIIKIPCIIDKMVRAHLDKIDIDHIKTRRRSGIG